MELERLRIIIQGQVQGVGFRPCVYRVAKLLGVTGWVRNSAFGVLIEVQGASVGDFVALLKKNLPPLAKVSTLHTARIPFKKNENSFEILESQGGLSTTIISPDSCICSDCLQELFDPQSRYFRYPFLNCTQCGPRFSITRALPYDRCHTSMDEFQLCPNCAQDYLNPDNRRYHAQPTACAHCGPQLSCSIEEIAQCIIQGDIVALKGLGGYQLICDAANEATVLKLRNRKNREAKPLALMVANLESAGTLVEVSDDAGQLLDSVARPIVLLRKKTGSLLEAIAPGLNHLGIMLPSTPLHYLLFNALAGNANGCAWLKEYQTIVLVVTSANAGGEPLIIDDKTADRDLGFIADKIVTYNRLIIAREDDSVVRLINRAPLLIRRSRGFVPTPIELPYAIPTTLALGGHLKNTFCITRGDEAFVSQHIGSLNNKATIEFFHESLSHLLKFLNVTPERIAHDLHPDFYTTRLAQGYDLPTIAVQHHHAHLASVVAEHGIKERVLGLALDGYGYGLNGEAWGGELLLLEQTTFERLGSFSPLLQPGGEIAAREPWRMGASVLYHLGRGVEISSRFGSISQAKLIHTFLEKKINSPLTSSCGRLFDAASALLGIQTHSQYEGQAAMQLECLVTQPEIFSTGWSIKDFHFNVLPLFEFLLNNDDPIAGSNLFHGTLIAGLGQWVNGLCQEKGIDKVVLSGGCFLNKILAEGLINTLSQLGIRAFLPQNLPPNDGGISLGQAWIAGNHTV